MRVAVVIETRAGEVAKPSLEALTLSRSLGDPAAVLLGEEPSAEAAAQLAEYGAQEVVWCGLSADDAALPVKAAAAMRAAAEDAGRVLFSSSFPYKEWAAVLAAQESAGIVVDAAHAELVDGKVVVHQTVFAATWNVSTRIDTDLALVGIRPNTQRAVPADPPAVAQTRRVEVELPDSRATLVKREPVEVTGTPLAEAPIVVSGGRGTGGDFTPVRELAEAIGGAVGATRDATDEGWIGHEHMVGQTGTTVTPALYVACGLSGAVHHRGGMQASGTIVAVNTDADAPIFEICDFGVVGDLADVLPQAIAALKAR